MNNDIDESLKIVEEAQKRNNLDTIVNYKESQIKNDLLSRAERKSTKREAIRKKRKEVRKKFAITFTAGALAGVLATVGVTGLYNKIDKNLKVKSADKALKSQAELVLLEQGLANRSEDGDITVKDNNIDDYRCLDLTHASNLEQHIYSEVLGKEFDDAIQTASYNNGGYYYTGINQWRNINGYIDAETGTPSLSEQRAAMEDKLLEAYNNNFEGIIRSSEELNEVVNKGGR